MQKRTSKKLDELLDFLTRFQNENGYPPSIREICSELNYKSTATASYYMSMLENVGQIRKAKNRSRAIEVITDEEHIQNNNINVPLVGNVTAGAPILAVENYETTFSIPENLFRHSGDLFMLNVRGESMIDAGINDGDIIVVNKQSTANNGDIVVAMFEGNATVKRFFKEKGYFRLQPENKSMTDIIVNDELSILGKVVGLIRNIK